jgi:hypothetical protein
MNDDEIRALIRVAIEKHLGADTNPRANLRENPRENLRENLMSFGRYPLLRAEDDAQCLIEPAVRCNHCGYCECHGH